MSGVVMKHPLYFCLPMSVWVPDRATTCELSVVWYWLGQDPYAVHLVVWDSRSSPPTSYPWVFDRDLLTEALARRSTNCRELGEGDVRIIATESALQVTLTGADGHTIRLRTDDVDRFAGFARDIDRALTLDQEQKVVTADLERLLTTLTDEEATP